MKEEDLSGFIEVVHEADGHRILTAYERVRIGRELPTR
jgi:hypothetical protein